MHIEGKNRTFEGKGLNVGVRAFSETWARTSRPYNATVSRSPAKNHFLLKRSGSGQIISPNGVFLLKPILKVPTIPNSPVLTASGGFRRFLKLF